MRNRFDQPQKVTTNDVLPPPCHPTRGLWIWRTCQIFFLRPSFLHFRPVFFVSFNFVTFYHFCSTFVVFSHSHWRDYVFVAFSQLFLVFFLVFHFLAVIPGFVFPSGLPPRHTGFGTPPCSICPIFLYFLWIRRFLHSSFVWTHFGHTRMFTHLFSRQWFLWQFCQAWSTVGLDPPRAPGLGTLSPHGPYYWVHCFVSQVESRNKFILTIFAHFQGFLMKYSQKFTFLRISDFSGAFWCHFAFFLPNRTYFRWNRLEVVLNCSLGLQFGSKPPGRAVFPPRCISSLVFPKWFFLYFLGSFFVLLQDFSIFSRQFFWFVDWRTVFLGFLVTFWPQETSFHMFLISMWLFLDIPPPEALFMPPL